MIAIRRLFFRASGPQSTARIRVIEPSQPTDATVASAPTRAERAAGAEARFREADRRRAQADVSWILMGGR